MQTVNSLAVLGLSCWTRRPTSTLLRALFSDAIDGEPPRPPSALPPRPLLAVLPPRPPAALPLRARPRGFVPRLEGPPRSRLSTRAARFPCKRGTDALLAACAGSSLMSFAPLMGVAFAELASCPSSSAAEPQTKPAGGGASTATILPARGRRPVHVPGAIPKA
eukprot:scaffold32690_cov65-Phaeocystis_antarctica.AAC.4